MATNPRLYKEIQLAVLKKFEVEVICFEFDNWSKAINERMKLELGNTNIIAIPAGRSPLIPWLWSVITEAAYRLAGRFIPLPVPVLSQAVSRRSNLIIKDLGKVSRPDWVIGHNPGAIWPALRAARKFSCKVGFDVEDYHPGEGNDAYMQKLTRQLMTKILPQMNYVSFASPLIKQRVINDAGIAGASWFSLLNYFPAAEFKEPAKIKIGPVQMVWFSQNISSGRGIELILPAVKKYGNALELHLFGNLDAQFYETCLQGIHNVIVHKPIAQKDLHLALNEFDIGLALEPAKDTNNELALSNKLLAYLQAGLYVVATNTPAQQAFLNDLPAHGIYFDYKTNNPEAVLENVLNEITMIRSKKMIRYENFETRNWETASLDLLSAWNTEN